MIVVLILTGDFRIRNSYIPFLKDRLGISKLPRWCSGRESTCQCRRYNRRGFDHWVMKILWSRKWQPTRVFLSGESHGQRSLAGYSSWVAKTWIWLRMNFNNLLRFKMDKIRFCISSTKDNLPDAYCKDIFGELLL